jgi:NADPH-dependent glutamate synthase beta subunit-like oxidoreductase
MQQWVNVSPWGVGRLRGDRKTARTRADAAAKKQAVGASSSCLQCQEPGCTGGCPIGVGVPSILSLVLSGRLEEASALIRLRSPLASITGRLCPSRLFCERACVLSRKGAPVSIRNIEAFLGDISLSLPVRRGKTASGNVIVVGSGPAGLMAAHDLHVDGFTVRVVESEALAGGCLRLLPTGLIPQGILDAEVERLAKSGIAFETSRTFKAEDGLPPKGCAALVLATGLPGARGVSLALKRDTEGFVVVDHAYRSTLPRVYAAGGAISQHGSITEAMASAREMAGHLLRAQLFPSPP